MLEVLPEGFAFACHLDGRETHPVVEGDMLTAWFCNCVRCADGRAHLRRSNGWQWPNREGFIAVRVAA